MLDATSVSFHRRLSSCECSFIRNVVAFVPPSILPSHRKQFSFLQLKSTKLALSKQRCKRFLKVVFAAKLTKATKKCKGASVYRSVPQDFWCSFLKSKQKSFSEGEGYPNSTQQMPWAQPLVPSYRKDHWLRHKYILSPSLRWRPERLFTWSEERNFAQASRYSLRNWKRNLGPRYSLMWTKPSTLLQVVWNNCAQSSQQISHLPRPLHLIDVTSQDNPGSWSSKGWG